MSAEYVPARVIESLDAYVGERRPTGGFLQAVLENDLISAAAYADAENFRALGDIALYVFHNVPSVCRGSRERVRAWLNGEEDA